MLLGAGLVGGLMWAPSVEARAPRPRTDGRRVPGSDSLRRMMVFSGNANKELAEEIAKVLGVRLGNVNVRGACRAGGARGR